jgi:hypothetical protein
MPAQSSSRGGFGSLLGGVGVGASRTDHLRVSDAERQEVADRLAEHYSQGRLDQAEFDERASRAMSAKTRGDLAGLFDDLPEPGSAGAPPVPPSRRAGRSGQVAGRSGQVQQRRRHGLLPIVAIVIIALVAAQAVHAVFWLTVPWLWLGFLAVVLLAATGHFRRH